MLNPNQTSGPDSGAQANNRKRYVEMGEVLKFIGCIFMAVIGICLVGDGFSVKSDLGELVCCAGGITISVALYLTGNLLTQRGDL